MFLPRLRLLLIVDHGNPKDTGEVLLHEGFHQFMHRHVPNCPTWLNEGLATHYGYAEFAHGTLSFGRPPAARWKLVRKAITTRKTIPLRQVITAGAAQFYDKTPIKLGDYDDPRVASLYYGEAYTLVHLLLSNDQGRQRLRDYLRALAAPNSDSARVTEDYFDEQACAALTPHWIKHVQSRPESR